MATRGPCGGCEARRAFSLIEIMIAVAILAFCFLPIITHSRSTIRETEVTQEDLVARHYLIDLVERFKGSSLGELTALGTDTSYLKNDSMLADHARVASELEELARKTGKVDQGLSGMKKYLDVAAMMSLTPEVKFTQVQSGLYELTLAVKWMSKIKGTERKIEFTKILAR